MTTRPKEHVEMEPYAKYTIFKEAYDRINLYKDKEDFLAAHVLSFSILEDRVTAAYVSAYRSLNKEDPPNMHKLEKVFFKMLIDILQSMGVIKEDLHKKLLEAANKRNELMHEMMWRLNAFNSSDVEDIRSLINEVETMTEKFVKLHGTKEDLIKLTE